MSQPGEDPIDALAEEVARRWRAGERPSVEEYALRYPQWEEEIRAVLPGVLLMEQLKPCREDAVPPAAVLPPQRPPDRLGEYRIIREIGRGGMGIVYEAEQETLGRRVAIKVLPGHLLANENLRSRFRREAQAAARLSHPHIVPVFAVGESDGQCYYVMQLIDGRGLHQALQRGGIAPPPANTNMMSAADWKRRSFVTADTLVTRPPGGKCQATPIVVAGAAKEEFCGRIAEIGMQVAEALAYAHSQGVLHRDIKPSNLLLDSQEKVWVTDFGVAKLVEEANLTQTGDLVGTLRYMPPERFSGQSDACGDVYGLGVTLYELLTHKPAFPDVTPHQLIRIITEEALPQPSKLNPDIPKDLETIVLKAVARDQGQRDQTAAELAEDLGRFLADRPIKARRTSAAERAWRWCRRNRALTATTAVSVLLMTALAAVLFGAIVHEHRHGPPPFGWEPPPPGPKGEGKGKPGFGPPFHKEKWGPPGPKGKRKGKPKPEGLDGPW